MKIGLLPLARPTFDVDYANEKLAGMLACLDQTGHHLVGPRELLFDEVATKAAIARLQSETVDQLLFLQVTFTDASMAVAAANAFDVPLSIWAVSEPRTGDRLRLNAFCGLNLASHAIGLNNRAFSWLYGDPMQSIMPDLNALLAGERLASQLRATDASHFANEQGAATAKAVNGKRIACVGQHPVGFDTCAYDADKIKAIAGVSVTAFGLDTLFDTARAVAPTDAQAARDEAGQTLEGLDDVNQAELDRSMRLKVSLDTIRAEGSFDAFAIRCWPEAFTEYGGAVCGPASMLGEARVPCACEADVYGALTQLILQEAAQAPVFLTDLVDMDVRDNTGVVWHCGQAPNSMRDPQVPATAAIHTNRKMPLLYQFALKPGPVTLLRISQARGQPKLVLGFAEMLRRPMAFTGTSGVLRFERGVEAVLDDVIASGLEHHMALAYGDHRTVLRGVAAALDLPLLEL